MALLTAADSKQVTHRAKVEGDTRDVNDIWTAAMQRYKGIVGFELQRKYSSVPDMVEAGTRDMESFHRWRHDQGKVDRLRTLFSENLDYLDQGSQLLLSAATTSFPPAAAIGTALTYLLSACRKQSADYNVVEAFFEDMQSFLKRTVIIQSRLPPNGCWQNCLMDVFTSFLEMSGVATKFVELGRFKKWMAQCVAGDDSELSVARDKLSLSLDRLRDATSLAILGNTEDLKRMNDELAENDIRHQEKLAAQTRILQQLKQSNEVISNGLAVLLRAQEENRRREEVERSTSAGNSRTVKKKQVPISANLIRNALPSVDDDEVSEYHIAQDGLVSDPCRWILSTPLWASWVQASKTTRPRLPFIVTGPPGIGKTRLAVVIYHELASSHAKDDRTAVTHFYFREHRPGLAVFRNAVYAVIRQISQHSTHFCDLFCAQFKLHANDIDVADWRQLVATLLVPAFSGDSTTQLFVVLDAVDELEPSENEELRNFLELIAEQRLSISIVLTLRSEPWSDPESSWSKYPCGDGAPDGSNFLLPVSMSEQLPTLKMMVWNRLNTLSALRRLSRRAKQTIADRIVKISPDLLHAEYLLSRFNEMNREGAVLRELDRDQRQRKYGQGEEVLPSNLHRLYDTMLADCERRTPKHLLRTVKELFCWMTFAFRPLVLDEVVSLIRYLSANPTLEPEDLPQVFSRFLVIWDAAAPTGEDDVDSSVPPSMGETMEEMDDTEAATAIGFLAVGDGGLRVEYRERTMRAFFRNEAALSRSRLIEEKHRAHRKIFLTCAAILADKQQSRMVLHHGLKKYAAIHVLKHIMEFQPDDDDAASKETRPYQKNVRVLEALGELLSNRSDFAAQLEASKFVPLSALFSDAWFLHMKTWHGAFNRYMSAQPSEDQQKSKMDFEMVEWWKSLADSGRTPRRRLVLDQAKAHLRRLYGSEERIPTLISYRAVLFFLGVSQYGNELARQAERSFGTKIGKKTDNGRTTVLRSEAALGLGLALDAIAEILHFYRRNGAAEKQCIKSLSLISLQDHLSRSRTLELLARIYWENGKQSKALDKAAESIEGLQMGTLSPCPTLQRAAHLTTARILRAKSDPDAVQFYRKAREADPSGLTPGDVLHEEVLLCFAQARERDCPPVAAMETLASFNSLDRLTWMTWEWWLQGDKTHTSLQRLAVHSDDSDRQVLKWYHDALCYLGKVNAGAPLRYHLARFHLQVRHNPHTALDVLNEILDGNLTGLQGANSSYQFTDEDPSRTLHKTIQLQTDVLRQLFCASADPAGKEALLANARALPGRSLALEASLFSTTALLRHRLVVARMVRKMGPAREFHRLLDDTVADARAALRDGVAWNDDAALATLGTALAVLAEAVPKMRAELARAAGVMVSARLEPETELDYYDGSVDGAGFGVGLRKGGGDSDEEGPEKEESDEEGSDEKGPEQEESDEEGREEEGSDEEGPDEEGSDEEGPDEEGSDEEGPDEEGSDEEGTDEDGGPRCPRRRGRRGE
ncbi:hypothetical protein N658DRAFT_561330 [Parathielavia hyrcaniae]|uniref:Uncharacterized protein n=1 Tax=Parathielavia hyrcaniae TaxID=113614 RepID=A0AAN6PUA0_9PEZI|nr:hypothetical protein N658DRAFT_561330 [Parathielavia hyrcaniae]